MALALLFRSVGCFGQPSVSQTTKFHEDESFIQMTPSEASLLTSLLGDVLHGRKKDGHGGYSPATFSVKAVLIAIRCLLTDVVNQMTFVDVVGMRINVLLIKALARHAVLEVVAVDTRAAECAVFSLYLLSHYGFKVSATGL